MDVISILKNLHPLEIKVLTNLKEQAKLSTSLLIEHLKFKEGHANQAFSWLNMKNLVKETDRIKHVFYELTDLGSSYSKNGTPETRLINFLEKQKKIKLPEITTALGVTFKEAGAAFSFLSKEGAVKMDEEKNVVFIEKVESKKLQTIENLLQKVLKNEEHVLKEEDLTQEEKEAIASISKKRGASDVPFKIVERDEIFYEFTPLAGQVSEALAKAGITGEETGQLTCEMLKSGEWKGKTFRAYNINLPPARMILGRTNPYVDFLESVKDKLVGMGF